jgi:hypothetical protein
LSSGSTRIAVSERHEKLRIAMGIVSETAHLMASESPKVLLHNPNTDVVYLPGRRDPSIAIEGERVSRLYDALRSLAADFKRLGDEQAYCHAFTLAEMFQRFLIDYEHALREHDLELPYETPIDRRQIRFDENAV